jgi:hypothetical protein
MRSLALLVVLCVAPAFAQERVFRASSLDIEQNERLDSLETRVTDLESKPTIAPPKPSVVPAVKAAQNLVKSPVKATKPHAVITIESLPGCQPCQRWKSKEADELRAVGWTVIEEPLTSASSAPFFRICINDRCFTYRGFMSHSALRTIIAAATGAVQSEPQSAKASRYSTDELRAMIQAKRPGGWTGPVYASVARSQAKAHLVSSVHGFSWDQVSGLTSDEALILHDLAPNHGNQIFPTR